MRVSKDVWFVNLLNSVKEISVYLLNFLYLLNGDKLNSCIDNLGVFND